jgi:hypothetical protein
MRAVTEKVKASKGTLKEGILQAVYWRLFVGYDVPLVRATKWDIRGDSDVHGNLKLEGI